MKAYLVYQLEKKNYWKILDLAKSLPGLARVYYMHHCFIHIDHTIVDLKGASICRPHQSLLLGMSGASRIPCGTPCVVVQSILWSEILTLNVLICFLTVKFDKKYSSMLFAKYWPFLPGIDVLNEILLTQSFYTKCEICYTWHQQSIVCCWLEFMELFIMYVDTTVFINNE